MDSFAQWFWLLIWWFLFFAYLVILFQIIGDLFRDHALSGWWKAVWIIFLIVVPFLTALIYIIARGKGMAERQMQAVQQAKSDTDSVHPRGRRRQVAGGAHRRREGAAGRGHDRPGRVRPAEGQGARLTEHRPSGPAPHRCRPGGVVD